MRKFHKYINHARKRLKHPEVKSIIVLFILSLFIPVLVYVQFISPAKVTQLLQHANIIGSCGAGTCQTGGTCQSGYTNDTNSADQALCTAGAVCCVPTKTQCEANGDVCTPAGYGGFSGCSSGQQSLSFSCNAGYICCRPGVAFPNGQGGNQCGNCQGQTCPNAGQYCEQPTAQNNQFAIYLCNQTNGTWQFQYNQTGSQTCTWGGTSGSTSPITSGTDTCTPSGGICIKPGTTCSALTNVNNPGSYIPATNPSYHCPTGNGQSCCMPGGNNQSVWQCKSGSCTNTQTGQVDNTQCNPLCTPGPTHKGCVSNTCVSVQGLGPDACQQDADCAPPKIYSITNGCTSPDPVCKPDKNNIPGCFDQTTCQAQFQKYGKQNKCTDPTSNGPGHCFDANAKCPNGATGTDDGPECGRNGILFPVVGQCCPDTGDGTQVPQTGSGNTSSPVLVGPPPVIDIKTGIDGVDNIVEGTGYAIYEIEQELPLLPPPLVYNSSSKPQNVLATKIYKGTGTLQYDKSINALVDHSAPLGNVPEGFYKLFFHVDGYLNVQLHTLEGSDLFYIQSKKISKAQFVKLIPGDIEPSPHGDNFIDVGDYNKLLSCFGKAASGSCKVADLNKDGKVDLGDFNLLVSHFGQVGDSYTAPNFTCTADPSCQSGQGSIQMCAMKCTKNIDFPF